MTYRIPNKIQSSQWLGLLFLLGVMGSFIQPGYAVTAFTPQNQPTGYMGQEIVTNGTLSSNTETLFRAEYEKNYWSGNLYSYPISSTGVVSTNAENWSGGAALHLEGQNFSTGRFIGTMKDDGTKVPFLSANLSAAQQTALGTTVQSIAYTSTQIVNFLRGDHSNESATTLRQRQIPLGASTTATVLGDIIHSKPYYQADATNPTVFVGSNDGMLHAINKYSGDERWAYVPSMLLSKMNALAANPYTHDYYVDGQIAVNNVSISGTSTRVLVGALGAGGKGLYALNIDGSAGLTAASDQDAANKVLWEITPTTVNYATPQNNDGSSNAAAYNNLGYTYGTPDIRTINIGTVGTPIPLQVVIIGNGYNNGGDYQAYLYIINAANGRLVQKIKADNTCSGCSGVTNGTSGSPNGLFNTLSFDSNSDGFIDTVYAGSLNGTLFKFNLSSTDPTLWTASATYNTSPSQPITATPAALPHPSGTGYIVNFATGSIFTGTQPNAATGATGDLGDTATFYVYGIWDGAPVSNTTLKHPVLTERCFNTAGTPSTPPCLSTESRVRRVTSVTLNWASGYDKGWSVALPAGERVVGEGSFISSGRYYFSTYNPTISYLVPNTTTYDWGENWQMALDSAYGNSVDPFMDLTGNSAIDNYDRIHYTAADTEVVAGTQTVNTPIITPNVDGIEVGKWVGRGVQSQPTLVKLTSLFTTLFNTNPDVTLPPVVAPSTGVTGGHFDVDIYHGPATGSSAATATINVSSTGSAIPATLGGIQIDGTIVVPALTVTDLPDGTATSTNAGKIKNKATGSTYTFTKSGSTITITAPPGASYNGKTITILPGTSLTPVPAVTAVKASQTLTFTNTTAITPTGMTFSVNGTNILTAPNPGTVSSSQLATWVAGTYSSANYTVTSSGSTVTVTAKTAVNTAYDISTLTASANTVAASTIVNTPIYTNGVAAVTASAPSNGTLNISGVASNKTVSLKCGATFIGQSASWTSTNSATASTRLDGLYTKINTTTNGYTITCTKNGVPTTSLSCSVAAPVGASACSGGFTVDTDITTTTNTGPAGGTTAAAAVPASASFTFNNTSVTNPTGFSVTVNGTNMMTATTPGSNMTSSQLASWVASNSSMAGYTISASGSTVTITSNTAPGTNITSIAVAGNTPLVTYTNGTAVAGVTAAAAIIGWSDLAPVLSVTSFSGGVDGVNNGDSCTTCTYDKHIHQYDKLYDVTGINTLNPNEPLINLSYGVPSTAQKFKVIIHNQYVNPAVKIHIGNPSYLPNVNFGYVNVKDYTTGAGSAGWSGSSIDLATLPTYVRDPAATGDGFNAGPKYIGSFALNMPVDALSAKNWWGNGDVRVGLIPVNPWCVWDSAGTTDGNMYRPIKAPANDALLGYPLDVPGTAGWSGSTTPATATGLRHGGALTVQIIRDTTVNSDLELNDHLGRPEYGWRVKSSKYAAQVLVEYNLYWHHPTNGCFDATGWTRTPPADNSTSSTKPGAAGATDPKIGSLSGSPSNVASVTSSGNTITVTYVDGSVDIVQKIVNADGTVTTVTIHSPSGVPTSYSSVVNADGTITTTVTTGGVTYTGTAASGGSVALGGGITADNTTTANAAGGSGTGGILNENALGYKRISWKELIRN